MGEEMAAIALGSLIQEFGLAEDSADGQLLDFVAIPAYKIDSLGNPEENNIIAAIVMLLALVFVLLAA